jgi:hypothetical protein
VPCFVLPIESFDVLLTVDQGVQYQQNLAGLRISIVVMVARSNDIDDLRPLLPRVLAALDTIQSGQIIRVRG